MCLPKISLKLAKLEEKLIEKCNLAKDFAKVSLD